MSHTLKSVELGTGRPSFRSPLRHETAGYLGLVILPHRVDLRIKGRKVLCNISRSELLGGRMGHKCKDNDNKQLKQSFDKGLNFLFDL